MNVTPSSRAATPRDLERVLAVARSAASVVMQVYRSPFEVEMKGPGDPVTLADRLANDLIVRELSAMFPDAAILAEESVPSSVDEIAERVAKPWVFFVDPVDGTREFAARNGEFAVMIGLAVDGHPVLGVCVTPVNDEAFCGLCGETPLSFREDAAGLRFPLALSRHADPSAATLIVSRSHKPRVAGEFMRRLGIEREHACGSVGVKVSRLVTGIADIYVHGGGGAKRWDTCAPEAIVRAAGGAFSDLYGVPIDYRASDLVLQTGIVATNGLLQARVLEVLGELIAERNKVKTPS